MRAHRARFSGTCAVPHPTRQDILHLDGLLRALRALINEMVCSSPWPSSISEMIAKGWSYPNGENFTPEAWARLAQHDKGTRSLWARLAQHDKGTRSLFVVCSPEGVTLWAPSGPLFSRRRRRGEACHSECPSECLIACLFWQCCLPLGGPQGHRQPDVRRPSCRPHRRGRQDQLRGRQPAVTGPTTRSTTCSDECRSGLWELIDQL